MIHVDFTSLVIGISLPIVIVIRLLDYKLGIRLLENNKQLERIADKLEKLEKEQ